MDQAACACTSGWTCARAWQHVQPFTTFDACADRDLTMYKRAHMHASLRIRPSASMHAYASACLRACMHACPKSFCRPTTTPRPCHSPPHLLHMIQRSILQQRLAEQLRDGAAVVARRGRHHRGPAARSIAKGAVDSRPAD
eukprot:357079-Chlamydomonas_euryale.AAC.7